MWKWIGRTLLEGLPLTLILLLIPLFATRPVSGWLIALPFAAMAGWLVSQAFHEYLRRRRARRERRPAEPPLPS